MRRMSFAMTTAAMRSREKTVTRRSPDAWVNLKRGDRVDMYVEKMGGARDQLVRRIEFEHLTGPDRRLKPSAALPAKSDAEVDQ